MTKIISCQATELQDQYNGFFTKIYFEHDGRTFTGYLDSHDSVYYGNDVRDYLIDTFLEGHEEIALGVCAKHHDAPYSFIHSDAELDQLCRLVFFGAPAIHPCLGKMFSALIGVALERGDSDDLSEIDTQALVAFLEGQA